MRTARKDILMKNKRTIGFLALLLATSLVIVGCNESKTSSSSSSSQPSSNSGSGSSSDSSSSSTSTVLPKYNVTFKSLGETLLTTEVEEGQLAQYNGPTPVKEPQSLYRFNGWEEDIYYPIFEDTVFNAAFSEYQDEVVIGDFEEFTSNSQLNDNGWFALGYTNNGYIKETGATVSLSNYAREGNKALRFDGWANQNDYKVSREFSKAELKNKAANAIKFSLMFPRNYTAKILLQGQVFVGGTMQNAYFSHLIEVPSNEYVDYIIPFTSQDWCLWGEKGKSMTVVANYVGFHQDNVLSYLTSIEFFFKGNDGAGGQKYFALIDDVSFVTLPDPQLTMNEEVQLSNRYSAITTRHAGSAAQKTMLLNISGGSATIDIPDIPHPVNISGTITAINEKEIEFKSSDDGATLTYRGKLMDGGQTIQYVSASSNDPVMVADVENMDFLEIQTVDNFEQYTEDGQAYCEKYPDKNARSGCRGAYYSEYYNGQGFSEWGGNGWTLMGSEGEQLCLKNDGNGHNSDKYVSMKNSESVAMRYMQWGLFDGSAERQHFRGTTFGFWAKTSGTIKSFKVFMYSQSKPINSTQNSNVKQIEITDALDAPLSEWTHYEIALNPALTYYGFMVTMEKKGSGTAYLFLDDLEVYTGSPYAEYISPYHVPVGYTYYGKGLGGINTSLEITSDSTAKFTVPGFGVDLPVTYTKDDYQLTFNINDQATYVADISLDMKTLSFVSVSGTNELLKTLLGNTDMALINYVENAETYTENGETMYLDHEEVEQSGARGAYYIDLHNGGNKTSPVGGEGWQLPSSASNLSLETTYVLEGKQSLRLATNKNGDLRYMQWSLYNNTAKPITGVDSFSFYLKSRRSAATNIKVLVYKVQQVTTETQGDEYAAVTSITMTGNQDWTRYTVNLDPTETYYGYSIMLLSDGATTGFVYLDKAYYCNSFEDQGNNFFASEGLSLTGTVTGSKAAQLDFGSGDNVKFTCAGLSLDHVDGTYKMEMNGVNQIIKISVANSVITGTYSIDNTGAITLTITNVSGDLASSISNGTFTGSLMV